MASMRRYAERHPCDVHVETAQPESDRHPAWRKVRLVPELLARGHEFVLWIDADAMFVRFDADVEDEIREGKDLHLVAMTVPWISPRPVPNTGVMLARNTEWTRALFAQLWDVAECVHHHWWDNAALLRLMGYHDVLGAGAARVPNHALLSRMEFLDERWNNSPGTPTATSDAIIRHHGGIPFAKRETAMRADAVALGLIPG